MNTLKEQVEVITMRKSLVLMIGVFMAGATLGATPVRQDRAVDRAFTHYERIRAALAQDTTKGIAGEASALAPLAAEVAGDGARRAAESVAQATSLTEARDRFGALSEALVPRFLEAGLPGVQGFVCSMNQKRWVQRGSKADNPYMGKAMATCGTRMKNEGKS